MPLLLSIKTAMPKPPEQLNDSGLKIKEWNSPCPILCKNLKATS